MMRCDIPMMESSKKLTTIMRSCKRLKEAMGRLWCSLDEELFDREEKGELINRDSNTVATLPPILMEGSP